MSTNLIDAIASAVDLVRNSVSMPDRYLVPENSCRSWLKTYCGMCDTEIDEFIEQHSIKDDMKPIFKPGDFVQAMSTCEYYTRGDVFRIVEILGNSLILQWGHYKVPLPATEFDRVTVIETVYGCEYYDYDRERDAPSPLEEVDEAFIANFHTEVQQALYEALQLPDPGIAKSCTIKVTVDEKIPCMHGQEGWCRVCGSKE